MNADSVLVDDAFHLYLFQNTMIQGMSDNVGTPNAACRFSV